MSAITDKIFKEYNSGELYKKIATCNSNNDEYERINSLIVLCYSYQFEQDAEEEENILLAIEELAENKPLEMPNCYYGTTAAEKARQTAKDSQNNLHNLTINPDEIH